MAKKYFVRYFIETTNTIGNRREIENGRVPGLKFNFGNTEIGLYDNRRGLGVDCYVDAESLEKSEEKSKTFVEYILNSIDFSNSSASPQPLFINAYDASPNLQEREFKQLFYVPIPERNFTPIDKDVFKEVFRIFNQNKDERIVRAVSWLRKGYLETKSVDKFIAFWTGLEAINELLADKFKIPLNERKSKCPKCGHRGGPITIGIEKLFVNEIRIEQALFREIRKSRGKLLHGGGPLNDEFIKTIDKNYNPLVRKALVIGIGKLLQINDEVIKKVIEKGPKAYNEKIRLEIRTTISELVPPKLEEFGRQPIIELTDLNLLERMLDKQGKLTLKMKQTFIFRNAIFKKISLDLYGENNTAIRKGAIKECKIYKY